MLKDTMKQLVTTVRSRISFRNALLEADVKLSLLEFELMIKAAILSKLKILRGAQ